MRVEHGSEKSRLNCEIDNLHQRLKGRSIIVIFNIENHYTINILLDFSNSVHV